MTVKAKTRTRLPKFEPVAVIDIGSNSVRLVVYDALRRASSPVFNEKVLCGLGRGVAATGKLPEEGVERALSALARFGALCEQIGVVSSFPIATAAAREAKNGPEFIKDAQAALGEKIRVLTGKEEAKFAGNGVIASVPGADGIVGDLGGGSLELVDVKDGEIIHGVTLPLGPFRLMDAIEASEKTARQLVEEALVESGMLDRMKGRSFYAVGGAWRNLAKMHMRQSGHPLSVLQQYCLTPTTARSVAILASGKEPEQLHQMDGISKKRSETLPLASVVLDRVVEMGEPENVVFSIWGVREGVLYSKLKKAERKRDPLIEGCWDFAKRYARSPEHERELCDWTDILFGHKEFEETEPERRLRHAACLMADVGWRASPDYRGSRSLNLITQANFVGIDHPARIFLALTIYFRYQGPGSPAPEEFLALMDKKCEQRARQLAATLRLAYILSAAMPKMLPDIGLTMTDDNNLRLSLPQKHKALSGEVVEKRLGQLANLMDCQSELVIQD